ncbi:MULTISPECIES: LysR family transcriptional regulator [Paraburkholderia]|jgi:DNA-binding transcriptional LysR family regulator|uniref:LysR family transcriptional regulator n=1 Tax=Paraburkholderia TaxID=1822464 RepID=UPI001CAB4FCF|nr:MULTISPECIES: LysR family transcriptional regulator [Paraburkholderia]GJH05597.1 LysR family transcriptional regulator [Paraburkholderia terrae]CAG9269888.1 LysR family transcriptional regulator [Paraburkholderia caribensis]
MSFDERILNGMGVLTAIVESGSFAGASERLDMSQSGVSRSVARLEARLGIRLFDRTTRTVKLTDEGLRLYEQIVPLMDGLEEAAASAAGGATAVRGRLRVNVDPFFSKIVLSPRIGEFIARYPELDLDLITRDQLGDMVADGFDLAVRFGEPRPSTLVARRLLDTRIVTAASPGYLKKHGRPLKPSDLEREPHNCIQYRDPETGRPFVWEFHRPRKKVIIDARGRLTVNDVSTMHGACLAGHGIAQIMALGTQPLFDSGRLVDLFPDWPDERFPLYALYPSRRHPSAKVRAFLEFIVKITGSPLNDKPWY